jgi:hypothetical protein
MKTIKSILIILLLLFTQEMLAQESCTEKLYMANKLYEKGKLDDAINTAQECSKTAKNTSEKWQAYRLLAMCYLGNGQQKEARIAAENMLELNPKYIPSKAKDPLELTKLLNEVKVIPKISLGIAATAGGNLTHVGVLNSFKASDYAKEYSSSGSWQFGLNAGYHLNEWLSFHTGVLAISKKYEVNYSVGGDNYDIKENLAYLDIPLCARFSSKPYKKFRLFVEGGCYGGLLLSSRSDFSATLNATSGEVQQENNLNSMSRRNKNEYGLIYGGGVMYKIKQVDIAIDVKYYKSYANITNEDARYNNQSLLYNYYFIDDDIQLSNLTISLSLFYNLNYQVLKSK